MHSGASMSSHSPEVRQAITKMYLARTLEGEVSEGR